MSQNLEQEEEWKPLEDKNVHEISISKESEAQTKDHWKTFKSKLPQIIQSIVFGIAYYNLAPFLLTLLNKKIFKSDVKFTFALYGIAKRQ